jgi:hypothetical protein
MYTLRGADYLNLAETPTSFIFFLIATQASDKPLPSLRVGYSMRLKLDYILVTYDLFECGEFVGQD